MRRAAGKFAGGEAERRAGRQWVRRRAEEGLHRPEEGLGRATRRGAVQGGGAKSGCWRAESGHASKGEPRTDAWVSFCGGFNGRKCWRAFCEKENEGRGEGRTRLARRAERPWGPHHLGPVRRQPARVRGLWWALPRKPKAARETGLGRPVSGRGQRAPFAGVPRGLNGGSRIKQRGQNALCL